MKRLARTGTAGVVLLVLAMAVLATVASVAAIDGKRAPKTVKTKSDFAYAEAIQEIQVGTSRREAERRLGRAESEQAGTGGGRCFTYEVVSSQTRYLLCFDRRNRLVSKSAS